MTHVQMHWLASVLRAICAVDIIHHVFAYGSGDVRPEFFVEKPTMNA
jgi:hypothetical protein